jgi:hypothetical protein
VADYIHGETMTALHDDPIELFKVDRLKVRNKFTKRL